jgi:hypothetical protein
VRPGPLTFHFGTDISSGRWRVVFTVPLLAIHTEIIIILHHAHRHSNVTIRLFPRHQFHTSHDERNNTQLENIRSVLYVLYQTFWNIDDFFSRNFRDNVILMRNNKRRWLQSKLDNWFLVYIFLMIVWAVIAFNVIDRWPQHLVAVVFVCQKINISSFSWRQLCFICCRQPIHFCFTFFFSTYNQFTVIPVRH